MPRRPDPKATGPMSLRPRNPEEARKFAEFRRICAKDGREYLDYFMPVIDRAIQSDNPQLHFNVREAELVLNKTVKAQGQEADPNPRAIKRTCPWCGGEGCIRCNNDGWVTEEPAP
jgi:hypothetical protein